jgi:prepilin-type N-terminal cleavage/methylation domain-containing protein
MERRAFTLIELLVVIAIIAILAAILFPVFAQAKMAGKGAASISNCKQVGTSFFIYSTDYDDRPPIVGNFDPDAPFLLLGRPYKPWAYLLMPYTKNGQIFQDPLTAAEPVPTGWNPQVLYTYRTQIGYAYTVHAPVDLTTTWEMRSTPQTALADSAGTVLLTIKKARNGQGDWLWSLGGPNGAGPIWGANIVTPPVCNSLFTPSVVLPRSVCPPTCANGPGGWGVGCVAYNGQTEAEGALTGGVALRKAGMSIVTFADSHAKASTPGSLAQGTNWTKTTPYQNVVITDITRYQWDMQ